MKIIDAHVHLVQYICGFGSRGELRAIGAGKARYADGSVISLIPPELGEYDVTPEKVIALMDQEKVEKAVILQGNYLGFQNEYALMAEKKYPNRFRAAITYDPFCRNKKLILENLVEKQGARIVKFEVSTGSGLMAAHETVALDGDYMEEAYQYAEAHGMVCVMDIGRAGTASYQPEALRRAILRHPEMKFVVCHVLMPQKGGEARMEEDLRMLALPNVWFDFAALPANVNRGETYPYAAAREVLKRAKKAVGADRLMFGSDLPSTMVSQSYRHLVEYGMDLFTETEREKVYHDTADLVFFGS